MTGTHNYDSPLEKVEPGLVLRQFYQKTQTEYLAYEQDVCTKEPAEIFYKAKEIVAVMLIYEHLLSVALSITARQVSILCKKDGLINSCCEYWNKVSCSGHSMGIAEMTDAFIRSITEEEEAAA